MDERSPARASKKRGPAPHGTDAASRLPTRFTKTELDASWIKAGRPMVELDSLSFKAHDELLHPFTLRVYLDLCAQEPTPPPIMTQADLIERWLNRRLDVESVPAERITRDLFHQALRIVATRIAATATGAVSVDSLVGVPRFEPAHPPGPVVQRLIEANILETMPGHSDYIRFAVETVQDFCLAEADIDDIKADAIAVARRLAKSRLTEAYPRIARIGRSLATDEIRHGFVSQLAEINPLMAAIIVAASPTQYARGVRIRITQYLASEISARHRVRAAFTITMLGELDCPEAAEVLKQSLFPPANAHDYLKRIGATAFIKLGHPGTAEFVFRWKLFDVYQGNDTYYEREQTAMLRRAKPDFREALAQEALKNLNFLSGDPMHARSVYVLASLGDCASGRAS